MRYKIQHEHYEKNPLQLEPEEEEEKCTCIKVLVVDDYGFNITCLKVMLEKWNLDIHIASNGQQALERIDEKLTEDPCGSDQC